MNEAETRAEHIVPVGTAQLLSVPSRSSRRSKWCVRAACS